jgi:hypothetical protein
LPNEYANDTMTVEECLAYAAAYNYAGIEYGRECWYGNSLDSGAIEASTDAPCSFLCVSLSILIPNL